MATFVVINQLDSPAKRGEDVVVTLNALQASIYLGGLGPITPGRHIQVNSSNVYGWVSEVDVYGTTFRAKPTHPYGNLASIYGGYLSANDLVRFL